MNDVTTSEEKKRELTGLLQFAKDVILFSTEFDNFIKEMFPDDKPLLETLPTHEFAAGRLWVVSNKLLDELKNKFNEPEKIIKTLESDQTEEILEKAYLAQAIVILAFRCQVAEEDLPAT